MKSKEVATSHRKEFNKIVESMRQLATENGKDLTESELIGATRRLIGFVEINVDMNRKNVEAHKPETVNELQYLRNRYDTGDADAILRIEHLAKLENGTVEEVLKDLDKYLKS